MDDDVIEARYVGRFVTWLRFRDNTSGEIDLERELYGPVFEPSAIRLCSNSSRSIRSFIR